jgi:plastocyanin
VKPTTRDRLVLPILLPVGILVVIALALWGFSRILLDVHGAGATTVALVVAGGIVVIAAIAAARPQVRGSTIAAMAGATAGIAMLAGGIALAVIVGGEEEGGEGPGPGGVVALVAQDIAFDPTTLAVPAEQPFTIAFDNRDAGIQHNVQIFDNAEHSGTALLDGELITGPAQVDYPVEPLAAGTYYFLCVVHPNMTGEIDAAEGGGEGGGGGEGAGAVPVSALNVAFDTDSIALPADAPSTIAFDNQDAGVQHNISIYSTPELAELLFQGELVTGPDSIDYAVPPLPAGEYYFHCDVHPNMNGAVVVDGAEGEEPTGEGPEPTGGG